MMTKRKTGGDQLSKHLSAVQAWYCFPLYHFCNIIIPNNFIIVYLQPFLSNSAAEQNDKKEKQLFIQCRIIVIFCKNVQVTLVP